MFYRSYTKTGCFENYSRDTKMWLSPWVKKCNSCVLARRCRDVSPNTFKMLQAIWVYINIVTIGTFVVSMLTIQFSPGLLLLHTQILYSCYILSSSSQNYCYLVMCVDMWETSKGSKAQWCEEQAVQHGSVFIPWLPAFYDTETILKSNKARWIFSRKSIFTQEGILSTVECLTTKIYRLTYK